MELNHTELHKLIKAAYKSKKPLNVAGHIGIGKSDTVLNVAKEIAASKNLPFVMGSQPDSFGFIDIRLNQMDPSDLRGLPMYDKENFVTVWYPPKWLPKHGAGILFFDEINLAAQMIQASAYQLILTRELGEYKLPDDWVIVSAGNLVDDRGGIYELAAPLANRFIHATLDPPTKEQWIDWAMEHDVDIDVVSYIQYRGGAELYKFDPEKDNLAFPTPRSWKSASDLRRDNLNASDREQLILMSSAIGDGSAREFMAFIKLKDSLDLENILKNPDAFKKPTRVDINYSLTSALSARYKDERKALPNILKIWDKMDPEYVVLSVRLCQAAHKTNFIADVSKIPESQEFINKYTKYFKKF